MAVVDKDRRDWWHKQQLMPRKEEEWKPHRQQSQCLTQHLVTNLGDAIRRPV